MPFEFNEPFKIGSLNMGKFLRSPSKVFWEDGSNNSAAWRSPSSNSGSQDSGFSDVEGSPTGQVAVPKDKSMFEKSFQKGESPTDEANRQNLSSNIKEKITPQKTISFAMQRANSLQTTPRHFIRRTPITNTAPVSRTCPKIISSRVSRNLFKNERSLAEEPQEETVRAPHQYSKQTRANLNSDDAEDNAACPLEASLGATSVRSLPAGPRTPQPDAWPHNLSAPAAFADEEAAASFDTSIDSSDSELECLFSEEFQPPAHTSTPKARRDSDHVDFRRKAAMNLMLKNSAAINNNPPPNPKEYTKDVQEWMKNAKINYEPECMTTLQCKSIAGELAEKVNNLASVLTLKLRDLSNYHAVIEQEFDNLKNHKKYMKPLVQSLCGLVTEFLQKYGNKNNCSLTQLCEDIKLISEIDMTKTVPKFYHLYKSTYQKILTNEAKKFTDELEDPHSEIHLRAMLTGLTSISLHNEELLALFSKSDTIETLVVLCEKCEGSTMKGLTFRALSTICTNSSAIRQFERASGVDVIVDTLTEMSRPEPERSEAVALLAQITAPWIDDNHTVSGLEQHNKKLVKSITKFALTTKCCQNLLLCAAALANLSTMNNSSIQYILHYNTVDVLLKSVKKRGPRASVYLLEQIAILLANVSAVEEAQEQLIRVNAAPALLCFLQTSCMDDAIVKRVQQKSMVALSRLCSHPKAAQQIVDLGGVERLIHLCREKEERCNSDAVLVAALVTLRKIIESCGNSIMSIQDVEELVQPRLLDSFLAYSTQNESYV